MDERGRQMAEPAPARSAAWLSAVTKNGHQIVILLSVFFYNYFA